jgi:hypothetical protein
MATEPHAVRKWLVVGAAVAGAAVGGATLAGAATSSSSSSTAPPTAAAAPNAPTAPDPATVSHGPGETLLTGTTADKVKAAALAAVPGATIIRVETDSDGSPYEAHLAKADGSDVTVKVDASFNVTATVDGFGGGPGHGLAGGAATGG